MTSHSIWVVDDDREDQLMMSEFFADIGIDNKVRFFDHGQLAINALNSLNQENFPSLIILDLNMPILNGTQTLLQIKRNNLYKEIKIIIFSTAENENEKRKCVSFGAVDYIVKPLNMEDGIQIAKRFASLIHE